MTRAARRAAARTQDGAGVVDPAAALVRTRADLRTARRRPAGPVRRWRARVGAWRTTRAGSKDARRRSAALARAAVKARPGEYGWTLPGGGRTTRIDVPPLFRGPAVQVCGLYPFSVGSSVPMVGAVLGPHLEGRGVVCADPIAWFLANLINNPSMFVLGRPGLGKSSLIRHIVAQLPRRGVIPLVLSDLKPDYVDLIRALDGQVIEVGRGREYINPLDPGPLAGLLSRLPARLADRATAEINGRRINVIAGLCELALGARLMAHETTALSAALRAWDTTHAGPDAAVPVVGDLRALVQTRHPAVRAVVQDRGDDARYDDRLERLLDALIALDGSSETFGDTFARATTTPLDMDRPAVFDLSSVEGADQGLQAGLQLVCWSYGSTAVAAAKYLAEAGLGPRRISFMVMDELWRALRAAEFMVDRVDEITRLNRQLGLGQCLCTHTMADLKLATVAATEKAWGFVGRSEMVFTGGLTPGEMGNLAEVFALSSVERAMLESWSVQGSVNPETGISDPPPGRAKFLLKIGKQTGIPFRVQLTEVEKAVNDTNKSWADAALAARTSRVRPDDLDDVGAGDLDAGELGAADLDAELAHLVGQGSDPAQEGRS